MQMFPIAVWFARGQLDLRANGDSGCIRNRGSAHSRFAEFFGMRLSLLGEDNALQSNKDKNETHCNQYNLQS